MVDLKTFRKKNGITQKELAKFLGITHGFISQVELGKSRLPEGKLEKLLNNDRGWAVDDLVETDKSTNLQTEVERLNKTIDGLNETIRIQGETIKTQSETISKQSETNINQLKAKINDIKTFLGSESSTKSGISSTYQQRVSTINKKYGTRYQVDDLQKLFSSSLWKKMEVKNYDSDTIMKAIGYIQNKSTDEDVFKGLISDARKRKNVPEFTGDPFVDEAVRDMLRSRQTVDEMYQYFKGI